MYKLKKDQTNNLVNEPVIEIDNLHTCISIVNLDESINWYQNVLGFKVVQHLEYPNFSTRGVFLESHGIEIELVESKGLIRSMRQDPPLRHLLIQGISQLSFRVRDLEDAAERLKRRSISIVFGPAESKELKLKAFFIRDNDGNLIEFVERSRDISFL